MATEMTGTRARRAPNFRVLIGIAIVLTIVRLFIGYLWFSEQGWKAPWAGSGGFGCDTYKFAASPGQELHGLCDWMQKEADHPAIGLYGDFVKNLVIPNFGLFAWSTFFIEGFVTFSLLLGFLTRLGGLLGALWAVNLLVGLVGVPGESVFIYLVFMVFSVLFAVIGAKNQFSVDALLANRYDKMAASGNPLGRLLKLASGAQVGSAGVL